MSDTTKKPTRLNYILANGFGLSTSATILLCVGFICWNVRPTLALLTDKSFIFWFIGAIIISLPLGWILGLVCVWPFVAAVGTRLNGSTFQVGDFVQVLTGLHRDRIFRVYDIWSSRNQVRVEIGEKEKKEITDVFCFHEVYRVSPNHRD